MTSRWSIIFFIAMVAATLHSSTAQRTHVVGDTSGWAIPSGGAIVYTNWASQQTFTQGDILVFNFATGRHNVAEVSRTSFDACNTTQTPISVATNAPVNITLNSTGEHYYICTFSGHCDAGMKLAINVSSPSTNTTTPPPPQAPTPSSPAPVPSPSRTPPPQSAPAPSPSRTSATYVVGDRIGWTFPASGNLSSYAAWASNKTFFVGDTLVFNFPNGRHNVAELRTSRADFDSCNTASITSTITSSPAPIVLTTPGEHFYVCTVTGHCDAGMKLAVNVSSSATTNAPPPSGGGFVPPPPSPSSASKFVVASAMPITLLSIAFALFY